MAESKPDRTGWMTGPLAERPYEPPFNQLTEFEQRALKDVTPLFGADEEKFLAQLQSVKVIDRINTIVGFYTRVVVDRSKCQPIDFNMQGALFDVERLKFGIGIVLWDEDGYLETIEGYTTEDNALDGLKLADLRYISVEQMD